jgi:uncharacterized protein (TIGR02271 family)
MGSHQGRCAVRLGKGNGQEIKKTERRPGLSQAARGAVVAHMSTEQRIPVVGAEGLIGYLAHRPARDGSVRLRLTDGRELTVYAADLRERNDGTYYLPRGEPDALPLTPADGDREQQTVVPVVEEQLVVEKRPIPTGRVRVHKKVHERQETVDLPLTKERVDIRRVVIDREVSEFPPVRREGDTTVIPVVEEVLVVEKRLRLKEEIHIVRHQEEERHLEQVTLKGEQVEIEQIDEEGRSIIVEPNAEPDVALPESSRPRGYVRRNKVVT